MPTSHSLRIIIIDIKIAIQPKRIGNSMLRYLIRKELLRLLSAFILFVQAAPRLLMLRINLMTFLLRVVAAGKLLHALSTQIKFGMLRLKLVDHQVFVVLAGLPLVVFLVARSVLQVVAVLAVEPPCGLFVDWGAMACMFIVWGVTSYAHIIHGVESASHLLKLLAL